ncbi:carboxypeptidase-like regulatory domain-containing protein [Algibacter sp. AS12]|uniref:carboxypeptidase-like regulatory domain-containing protein n=1 Tax=Algibacter sp. AS12 TaxID=3135773 RepID=UPI00398B999C
MKHTLTTLLFFVFLSFNLVAQENSFLSVKVVDSISNIAVSFATIRIAKTSRGLIADEAGNFRLPQDIQTQHDSLIISAIGFKTKYVNLNVFDNTVLNIVKLAPKVEVLETITITKSIAKKEGRILTANQIVTNAVQNIKINYAANPFSYLAYYRDYQVFENQYFNFNEGLIEVFDAGFKTNQFLNKENKTALYSYALNTDFKQSQRFSVPYDNKSFKYIENANIIAMGGNELSILQLHDPIRNHDIKNLAFIYNLETDFIKNHDFELLRTTFLNDKPIYEIGITKKFKINSALSKRKNKKLQERFKVQGTIYISKGNFEIHKIQYAVFEGEAKNSKYAINLEYTPKNNVMYLNYLSFNNAFKFLDETSFKTTAMYLKDSVDVVHVDFNNPVNPSTLKKENFKLYYTNIFIPIKSIELVGSKSIKIYLKANTFKKYAIVDGAQITLYPKNILDTANKVLNKPLFLDVNQFREVFVQEVFSNKQPDSGLQYVNKSQPLSHSQLNKMDNSLKYWLNTPLKKAKQ